jgi:hypothetical protein
MIKKARPSCSTIVNACLSEGGGNQYRHLLKSLGLINPYDATIEEEYRKRRAPVAAGSQLAREPDSPDFARLLSPALMGLW